MSDRCSPLPAWVVVSIATALSGCPPGGHLSEEAKKPPPMRLTYRWSAGQSMAPGVSLYDRRLEIDEANGRMTYESFRSPSDGGGEAIGLFTAPLPAGAVDRIATVLAAVLKAPVPDVPSRPGPGSVMELRMRRGEQEATLLFEDVDMGQLERAEPVVDALDGMTVSAMSHPVSALKLTVARDEGPGFQFILMLENVGTEPVRVSDPLSLPSDDPNRRALVRVARVPEGDDWGDNDLQWIPLPLAPPAQPRPAQGDVLVPPGGRKEWRTAPWKPKGARAKYVVTARWSDYTGPDRVGGVYRVRGALASRFLELEAP